ncbi:MAG: 2OG-Fe(II) oxygenase [Flavobacteriaceae bacterium]|nr:2OG-Fe(II) oxygenase [Flavobacteriaceae bacterium]
MSYKINADDINLSLEEKSWFYQENFVSNDLCLSLTSTYLSRDKKDSLIEAKIGIGSKLSGNAFIRNGSVKWIDDWNESSSLNVLNSMFSEIMISIKDYFRLSIKRFESQFSFYNQGGFYKCHLDQHKTSRHRQISCCLYLNDCIEGGELVIYARGSKTKIDKIIKPLRGSLVLFFSADIYHEVKVVHDSRYSITTWFRDDKALPFI